ncbi:MAG: hypothetical protein COA37_18500 [Hoeflea sp.]|uniref:hypothetical protein n=1 Tax=Hoeflea sp. TaxID=1940281 RepID=UPI000C1187EF|nr:hypothetical protein [Hoeflea sp.]PHR18948.1 MAG: hypothetical protein COA37_18500 [Hoeflea sp.]
MLKIDYSVWILAVSSLLAAPPLQAHDRHQVIIELRNGQALQVDMDEWVITSLLDMDFVLDEMRKVTEAPNPYSEDVRLLRLRSASAVLQHKSNIFDKLALSALAGTSSERASELSPCNLALKDIDKKISNIVDLINDEEAVFDSIDLDQSFGEHFSQCVEAIKDVN